VITFEKLMDPRSLNIMRGGDDIGFLQWHSDRPARIILHEAGQQLDHNELQTCLDKFKEIRDHIDEVKRKQARCRALAKLDPEDREALDI